MTLAVTIRPEADRAKVCLVSENSLENTAAGETFYYTFLCNEFVMVQLVGGCMYYLHSKYSDIFPSHVKSVSISHTHVQL